MEDASDELNLPVKWVKWSRHSKFQSLHFLGKLPLTAPRAPTFPHGDSHEGSPGFEAFHRAKSFWDFFSLSLSAEMLRSPIGQEEEEEEMWIINVYAGSEH